MDIEALLLLLLGSAFETRAHFLLHEALQTLTILIVIVEDSPTLIMLYSEDMTAWLDPVDVKVERVALVYLQRQGGYYMSVGNKRVFHFHYGYDYMCPMLLVIPVKLVID